MSEPAPWHIFGHAWAVDLLRSGVHSGRLAHSTLIAAPPNTGAHTLAALLARALLCQSPDRALRPCGTCRACKLTAAGTHPDLHTLRPPEAARNDDDDTKRTIPVEAVRELRSSVMQRPYLGSTGVAVVDIDYLNDAGANALLKILEEPPPYLYFLLLTRDSGAIWQTISSRCQTIQLRPLAMEEVRAALIARGTDPDRADLLARLSGGRIGWALNAVDNPSELESRTDTIQQIIALSNAGRAERFAYASKLATQFGKDPAAVRQILSFWLNWWRDVLLLRSGCDDLITNIDHVHALSQLANERSLESIYTFGRAVETAMRQLEQNVNPTLALEVMLLKVPAEEHV